MDLGGVQRNGVFGEFESLLDEGGEFTDASSLLAENFLGVGGSNDDVGDGGGNANFDARVALFRQFTLEELVQLSEENTICNELSALGAGQLSV